jgi:hypothetical protein
MERESTGMPAAVDKPAPDSTRTFLNETNKRAKASTDGTPSGDKIPFTCKTVRWRQIQLQFGEFGGEPVHPQKERGWKWGARRSWAWRWEKDFQVSLHVASHLQLFRSWNGVGLCRCWRK